MLRRIPLALAVLTALVLLAGAASAGPAKVGCRDGDVRTLARAGLIGRPWSAPPYLAALQSVPRASQLSVTAFVPQADWPPHSAVPARR